MTFSFSFLDKLARGVLRRKNVVVKTCLHKSPSGFFSIDGRITGID